MGLATPGLRARSMWAWKGIMDILWERRCGDPQVFHRHFESLNLDLEDWSRVHHSFRRDSGSRSPGICASIVCNAECHVFYNVPYGNKKCNYRIRLTNISVRAMHVLDRIFRFKSTLTGHQMRSRSFPSSIGIVNILTEIHGPLHVNPDYCFSLFRSLHTYFLCILSMNDINRLWTIPIWCFISGVIRIRNYNKDAPTESTRRHLRRLNAERHEELGCKEYKRKLNRETVLC